MKLTAILALFIAFSAHANPQYTADQLVSESIQMKEFKKIEMDRVILEDIKGCEILEPNAKDAKGDKTMVNIYREIARRTNQPVESLVQRMGPISQQKVDADFPKSVYIDDQSLVVGSADDETREILGLLQGFEPNHRMALANTLKNPPLIVRNEEGAIAYAAGNLFKDRFANPNQQEIVHVSCVNIGFSRNSIFNKCDARRMMKRLLNEEYMKKSLDENEYLTNRLLRDDFLGDISKKKRFYFKKSLKMFDSYACYVSDNLY